MEVDDEDSKVGLLDHEVGQITDYDGFENNANHHHNYSKSSTLIQSKIEKPASLSVLREVLTNGGGLVEPLPPAGEDCPETSRQNSTNNSDENSFRISTFPYPYECQFCDLSLKSFAEYEVHMVQHDSFNSLLLPCSICKRTFGSKDELNLHLRLHKGIKPHKCKVCEKQYFFARSLEYHLQSHGGIRLFKCQMCDSSFISVSDMNEHLKEHFVGGGTVKLPTSGKYCILLMINRITRVFRLIDQIQKFNRLILINQLIINPRSILMGQNETKFL